MPSASYSVTLRTLPSGSDLLKLTPGTEHGKIVRSIAIDQAKIATYTNDSLLSKICMKFRDFANNVSGKLRLGDMLYVFVKTPANVIDLSLKYSGSKAVEGFIKAGKAFIDLKKGLITPEEFKNSFSTLYEGLVMALS